MHILMDIFGDIGVLAILQQHGDRGPQGEIWFLDDLLLILFFGGLVAVVTWLVVRIFPKVRRDERPEAPRDSAEEILRERFARGEISAEEFQKSVEILRSGTARSGTTRSARDANQEGG